MKNMTSAPQTLKGFRDILPADALKRQWLKDKIIEVFELWGYDPIETPTLEPLEIFEGQIGEGEKMFYKFKDPGKRNVALRYDQTVPTCRFVGQYYQSLPMPFRRYQIQPSFRAEKPQKGRYREFVQCDADIFGSSSPLADAEVIALGLDIYRQLGFKEAKVRINDRSLLKDLPYEAVIAIDKLEKVGRSGVIEEMMKFNIPISEAEKYLTIVESLEPNNTISMILSYLKNQGFPASWYEFDPTIARSFSYSSGPIWEIIIPNVVSSSVLGGERFDQLVKQVSGVSIPATGFGLGFDRTLEVAEELNLVPEFKTNSEVLVTIFEASFIDESSKLASELRNLSISTELYPNPDDKLSKQLKYADKKKIPFVVILGSSELDKNQLTVKNMRTGEQKRIERSSAISLIQSSL